jgi:hypothetical protein
MSALSSFIACPNVQLSLFDSFGVDNLKAEPLPLLSFILSAPNRSDVIQNQINFRDHGRKTVEVVYGQRFLESMVQDGGRVTCGTFSNDGETSVLYSLTPSDGYHVGFKLTASELEERCEADSNYIAREIFKMMDVLARKVATNAAIQIIANGGNFASDVDAGNPAGTSTSKNAATVLTSGAPSMDATEVIAFQNMANEFTNMPFVFGGEPWWKYIKGLQASTGAFFNDDGFSTGLYAQQAGITYGYDRRIQLNDSSAAAAYSIIPGAVQMISFNEFKGILEMNDSTLVQGTLQHPDPSLPLTFDYRAEYTCNGADSKVWNFEVALNHDFIFLPSDMYQAGDRLEGVNGILKFIAV